MSNKNKKLESGRLVIYTVVGILLCILVIVGLRFLFGTGFITINNLHNLNIEGEESEINYIYNGFSFIRIDPLWYTKVSAKGNIYNIPFRFGPREVEHIPIDMQKFSAKIVFLTMDPELTSRVAIAPIEIGRILGNKYDLLNIPVKSALTKIPEGKLQDYNDTIIKTCEDATEVEAVFLFISGNKTMVYEENNCVIIQGVSDDDIIKAADRLAYGIIGVF